MKIASASVQLQASHTYREQHQQREALRAWRDDDSGSRQEITLTRGSERLVQYSSAQTMSLAATTLPTPVTSAARSPSQTSARGGAETEDAAITTDTEPRLSVLILIIERLTGRKVQIFDASELSASLDSSDMQEIAARHDRNGREGWGLVYDYSESYGESETTHFSAEAVVRTGDGQEIAVSVELNMHREFASQHKLSLRAGDALKDPLVINFDGTAAALGPHRIRFDIDADGRLDEFAFVDSGSGMLALDRNGDGIINDGSELFGALSGNGFADLVQYDADRNQWLDENDAVFPHLLIWSKDANGDDSIEPLLKRNIGAIYLGAAPTPFALKDQENVLLGQIRASGIYLTEDGASGTLQQIDLVV